MLDNGGVSTRLPAQDLDRARAFYSDKLGLEPIEERPGGLLYRCARGEFALFHGLTTVDGLAEVPDNYPSKGVGERAAWFKDSEGNLLAIGQPIRGS